MPSATKVALQSLPIHGIQTTSTAGEYISIVFLYETTNAMAMTAQASSTAFNPQTLDLPSISTIVSFYHACLGFPVKQTWLDAIKAGSCDTFDGLTSSNVARYCPNANETILGYLAQQSQNVRSTKPKQPKSLSPPALLTHSLSSADEPSNQVYIKVYPLSKLDMDDTGRFTVRARSGNQYIMIAFHTDGNLILQQEFKSKNDPHHIAAYNVIMLHLTARGLSVDLQILDNETSVAYKEAITFKWNTKFQLVPPHMHCQNQAERTICAFKVHSLAVLAITNSAFPPYFLDLLLPQAELTLNLLQQATLNPRIGAWEFFQRPFDFNKTPLGCCVLIHAKLATRQSLDFRVKPGFYIGPPLDSYRCFKLVKADTKSQVILDTIKFCHVYLSVPVPSVEDEIIHSVQVVAGAIQGAPTPTRVSQLKASTALQEIFESWRLLAPPSLWPTRHPAPASPRVNLCNSPRLVSPSPPSTSPTLAPSTALSPPSRTTVTSLTPLLSTPTLHATPCCLNFGNAHSPRVVSKSQ
jgi:hypothetical protein